MTGCLDRLSLVVSGTTCPILPKSSNCCTQNGPPRNVLQKIVHTWGPLDELVVGLKQVQTHDDTSARMVICEQDDRISVVSCRNRIEQSIESIGEHGDSTLLASGAHQ